MSKRNKRGEQPQTKTNLPELDAFFQSTPEATEAAEQAAKADLLPKAYSPLRRPALVEARKRWPKTGVKTAYGNPAVDSGDGLAVAWRGKTLEEVRKDAAERLGSTEEALLAKYGHLNAGSQRMTLGNLVRAVAKRAAEAVKDESSEA